MKMENTPIQQRGASQYVYNTKPKARGRRVNSINPTTGVWKILKGAEIVRREKGEAIDYGKSSEVTQLTPEQYASLCAQSS